MIAQNQNVPRPEPVFPELIPLVQDKPEEYDPETQDNTGHFPEKEEQADALARIQIMQNVFQMSASEMICQKKSL